MTSSEKVDFESDYVVNEKSMVVLKALSEMIGIKWESIAHLGQQENIKNSLMSIQNEFQVVIQNKENPVTSQKVIIQFLFINLFIFISLKN